MIFPNQIHCINQIKKWEFYKNANKIENSEGCRFCRADKHFICLTKSYKNGENALGRDICASIHKISHEISVTITQQLMPCMYISLIQPIFRFNERAC